jgi:hypothetical protein
MGGFSFSKNQRFCSPRIQKLAAGFCLHGNLCQGGIFLLPWQAGFLFLTSNFFMAHAARLPS